MITVYISTIINPGSVTYATAVHTVDGVKILKDDYCIVLLDGPLLPRSSEMLRDKNGLQLSVEPLHKR